MTGAYRTIPNPVYMNFTIQNMETSNPTHFLKTTLCTYISSNIQLQSISLHIFLITTLAQNIRRILICSSVRSACTWKIVFKTQNNELNELSECMLYKMFFFFGKSLKTVKLSFTEYFPEALLAYFNLSKTVCTCLLLKVYKTFNTCLLSLLFFSSKSYKTFSIHCLLTFPCFSLKVYKNFYKLIASKRIKHFANLLL